jgi:hypothetical protein
LLVDRRQRLLFVDRRPRRLLLLHRRPRCNRRMVRRLFTDRLGGSPWRLVV